MVGREVQVATGLDKTRDNTVDAARVAVIETERDGYRFANDLAEIKARIRRDHFKIKIKQAGHALLAVHAGEHQHVGTQRRRDREVGVVLGVGGGHARLAQ